MWYWEWIESENRCMLFDEDGNRLAYVYYEEEDNQGWTWIEYGPCCGYYQFDTMEECQDDCLKYLRGRK